MATDARRFRYYADPACVACLLVYPLNRWMLKPHHIGGWFTHGYLNDVICLPLFLPLILFGQRVLRLRRHDGFPQWWEIAQHWAIFSVVFEVVLPRMGRASDTTGDAWDVVAYAAGGIIAGVWWHRPALAPARRAVVTRITATPSRGRRRTTRLGRRRRSVPCRRTAD